MTTQENDTYAQEHFGVLPGHMGGGPHGLGELTTSQEPCRLAAVTLNTAMSFEKKT